MENIISTVNTRPSAPDSTSSEKAVSMGQFKYGSALRPVYISGLSATQIKTNAIVQLQIALLLNLHVKGDQATTITKDSLNEESGKISPEFNLSDLIFGDNRTKPIEEILPKSPQPVLDKGSHDIAWGILTQEIVKLNPSLDPSKLALIIDPPSIDQPEARPIRKSPPLLSYPSREGAICIDEFKDEKGVRPVYLAGHTLAKVNMNIIVTLNLQMLLDLQKKALAQNKQSLTIKESTDNGIYNVAWTLFLRELIKLNPSLDPGQLCLIIGPYHTQPEPLIVKHKTLLENVLDHGPAIVHAAATISVLAYVTLLA